MSGGGERKERKKLGLFPSVLCGVRVRRGGFHQVLHIFREKTNDTVFSADK